MPKLSSQIAIPAASGEVMAADSDEMEDPFAGSDEATEDDHSEESEQSAAKSHKSHRGRTASVKKLAERKPGRPRGKGHKAASPKKKPKAAKVVPAEQQCFVCPLKKVAAKKICAKHKKDSEAMYYQAQKRGQEGLETYRELFKEENTARLALDRFDRENPEGKFRKALIEWSSYKRQFIVEKASTHREGEEEWTLVDWIAKRRCEGETDNMAITREWLNKVDAAPPEIKEGEGENATLWLPRRRQRFRDTTRRILNTLEDSSKNFKSLSDKERQNLMTFAQTSSPGKTILSCSRTMPAQAPHRHPSGRRRRRAMMKNPMMNWRRRR